VECLFKNVCEDSGEQRTMNNKKAISITEQESKRRRTRPYGIGMKIITLDWLQHLRYTDWMRVWYYQEFG